MSINSESPKSVLLHLGIQYKEDSDVLFIKCPFTSEHNSVIDKKSWRLICFECKRIMRLRDWMKLLKTVFPGASSENSKPNVGILALVGRSLSQIEIERHALLAYQNLQGNDEVRRILQERTRISSPSLDAFKIGWSGEHFLASYGIQYGNCFTFPVCYPDGTWKGIMFLGRKVLSESNQLRFRLWGKFGIFWAAKPHQTKSIMVFPNPIQAITSTQSLVPNDLEVEIVSSVPGRSGDELDRYIKTLQLQGVVVKIV